ncbi:hypothetical protein CAC42_6884 [Sphaceloma murrayae]|uniref:Major facilitator superfamily (MFS) profile domain-containing protein n=1 Tax=Sphaceloma murrayae TaxID=2082308 RepID=A0A2K1QHG6_9PEZI|nr:hypothetical protein CAC42_6884 [Sphaceloma murrayae]
MSDTEKSEILDTIHNDEALKVLSTYVGDTEWSKEEEDILRRRIDWNLMPVLCFTYALQYYDKSMISAAALFGLRTDLELTTGNRYSFCSAIFYLGFIVGAYPAMMLVQRYPIERVTSVLVTVWGICVILTTACRSYRDIYAQRFFLGLLEAGVSPLFMVIVGTWYKKAEQAFRMGIWYSCTGFAAIFAPLINYGLGQIGGPLNAWYYMYFFAGSITTLWGIALWWLLPPDPIRTKILDPRQKYIAVARLRSNNSGVRNKHLKVEQIYELLTDVKFWLMFTYAFLSMVANGPVSTFIPIIINGFGFSTLNSLLLSMPAGFISGVLQLIGTWLAYRYPGIRTYLMFGFQMLTILAALLLWLLPLSATGGLLYGCFTLASFGAGYAVCMGVQIANIAGYTKRTVASSGLYVGYCLGNFVGPLVFKPQDAPRYVPGFIITTSTAIAAGAFAILYRLVCMWDNRRRDKTGVMEGFDHAYEDDLTDKKNSQFRYVL